MMCYYLNFHFHGQRVNVRGQVSHHCKMTEKTEVLCIYMLNTVLGDKWEEKSF